MDRKELITEALKMLVRSGYVIGCLSPRKGVDILVYPNRNGDEAIFVAVCNGDNRKSIPLQGLGSRKRDLARAAALKKGAEEWKRDVGWKGPSRFDAVWITREDFPMGNTHIINIHI